MIQESRVRAASASPTASRDVEAFYRTAHLGLRQLDARGGPKRFDSDAEARWRLFRGHLDETDRLDLLVRDAAVAHPAAFAPRDVFDLEGLADDEPFGPDWPGPKPLTADELRRDAKQPPAQSGVRDTLQKAARFWDLGVAAPGTLPDLTPAARVLAAGTGGVVALAERFEGATGFDLAEQVALVTAQPGERQLFGLAAALLGSFQAICFVEPRASADQLRDVGWGRVDRIVVSPDATSTAREAAQRLGAALGAT